MITRIHIQNYRSFVDAEVKLRPFSLVIGANGAGKTNLLRLIEMIAVPPERPLTLRSTGGYGIINKWETHQSGKDSPGSFLVHTSSGDRLSGATVDPKEVKDANNRDIVWGTRPQTVVFVDGAAQIGGHARVYSLDAAQISKPETISSEAQVGGDGSGTVQVLDSLKNGDREDLFDSIESTFKRLVPEVEKLSTRIVGQSKKQIQVRERGLKEPLPASELSEGTRLILCILTIIHQEKPPPVILLEDIDRGMHPRIFEQVVPLMREIAEKHDINIIATTHNPYLVDCFQDDKEAVIIVEKKDGASTLSTLASRLEGLDYDKIDPDDMPLGNLWYSGFVGGVPARSGKRAER